jgi:excisionase family DNA binding protein
MSQQLYSVVQVAEMLGLHVRTVRNYVRYGRLKATRIGKQYRIAREDLEALTGGSPPLVPPEEVRRARHIDTSCVVQIHAIAPEAASRVRDSVTAALNAVRSARSSVRLTSEYDEGRGLLKFVISGEIAPSAGVLQLVQLCLDQ